MSVDLRNPLLSASVDSQGEDVAISIHSTDADAKSNAFPLRACGAGEDVSSTSYQPVLQRLDEQYATEVSPSSGESEVEELLGRVPLQAATDIRQTLANSRWSKSDIAGLKRLVESPPDSDEPVDWVSAFYNHCDDVVHDELALDRDSPPRKRVTAMKLFARDRDPVVKKWAEIREMVQAAIDEELHEEREHGARQSGPSSNSAKLSKQEYQWAKKNPAFKDVLGTLKQRSSARADLIEQIKDAYAQADIEEAEPKKVRPPSKVDSETWIHDYPPGARIPDLVLDKEPQLAAARQQFHTAFASKWAALGDGTRGRVARFRLCDNPEPSTVLVRAMLALALVVFVFARTAIGGIIDLFRGRIANSLIFWYYVPASILTLCGFALTDYWYEVDHSISLRAGDYVRKLNLRKCWGLLLIGVAVLIQSICITWVAEEVGVFVFHLEGWFTFTWHILRLFVPGCWSLAIILLNSSYVVRYVRWHYYDVWEITEPNNAVHGISARITWKIDGRYSSCSLDAGIRDQRVEEDKKQDLAIKTAHTGIFYMHTRVPFTSDTTPWLKDLFRKLAWVNQKNCRQQLAYHAELLFQLLDKPTCTSEMTREERARYVQSRMARFCKINWPAHMALQIQGCQENTVSLITFIAESRLALTRETRAGNFLPRASQ